MKVTDAIAELLLRHHLGDFPAPVRRRLQEIFTTDPPDALERLTSAAAYLGITALTAGTLERSRTQNPRTAAQQDIEPQRPT